MGGLLFNFIPAFVDSDHVLAIILYGLALLILGGFRSLSLSLFETPTGSPEG